MPHARSKMPMWRRQNLTLHRKKHASCFADIHQVPLATISDGKFEIYSNDCFEKPMLSYAGDYKDAQAREYVGVRHYFVTFYHEHFDRPHGERPERSATEGQRKLEYEQAIERDIDSRKLRYFKRLG